MFRWKSSFAVSMLFASSVAAQEGLYKNRFQTVVIDKVTASTYAVEMSASNGRGCGGSLKGEGRRRGNILVVEARDQYVAGACVVTIQFGRGYINVEEEAGCTSFHGAACGFTGRLTKR